MNSIILYFAVLSSLAALALSIYVAYLYRKELHLMRTLLKKRFGEAIKKPGKLRKRYIVFSIVSEDRFSKKEIEDSLKKKISKVYGIIGAAKADPKIVFYDPSIKKGIVRTSHKEKDLVLAVLSLIREINGKKVLIIPLKTTGTIKRARKYMYSIKRSPP